MNPALKTLSLILAAALLGAIAGIGGYLGYERWQAAEVEGYRPHFELPDFEGELQAVSQWDGQVLVLNFWASWCPPCVREIPAFVELQEEYGPQGVQFVGIAIDRLENARTFAEELGVNYPQLHGVQNAMEVGEAYGNLNGTLPYTVLIDRNGVVSEVFAYEVDHETMEQALQQLL